jgi:FKBP-type peptidyl-prolyl cis-trans isomerase FkpA
MCLTPIVLSVLLAQTPAAPAKKAAVPAKTAPAAAKPATGAPAAAGAAKPAVRPVAKPGVAKPAAAAASATPAPTTDEQKTLYALGLSIYRSLGSFELSEADVAMVAKALIDAQKKQPAVEISEWGPKIQQLQTERRAKASEKAKAASAEYLAKAASELGALKTDSGLVYKELSAGSGASPTASDTVKVHYRGTLTDGTEFDSSYKRGEPAQFPLGGVVPCWTEGVQKMKVGGKARLVCPSSLAYGDNGQGPIPGGAALIFEIELLEIVK